MMGHPHVIEEEHLIRVIDLVLERHEKFPHNMPNLEVFSN